MDRWSVLIIPWLFLSDVNCLYLCTSALTGKRKFTLSISSDLFYLIWQLVLPITLKTTLPLTMKQLENQFLTFLNSVIQKLNSKHLAILFALLMIVLAICLITSCGTTKAVVKHSSENARTMISVTTANPTSVQVSPITTISKDSLSVNTRKN